MTPYPICETATGFPQGLSLNPITSFYTMRQTPKYSKDVFQIPSKCREPHWKYVLIRDFEEVLESRLEGDSKSITRLWVAQRIARSVGIPHSPTHFMISYGVQRSKALQRQTGCVYCSSYQMMKEERRPMLKCAVQQLTSTINEGEQNGYPNKGSWLHLSSYLSGDVWVPFQWLMKPSLFWYGENHREKQNMGHKLEALTKSRLLLQALCHSSRSDHRLTSTRAPAPMKLAASVDHVSFHYELLWMCEVPREKMNKCPAMA